MTFRVRKIHKYTFLGRALRLIWHRLAVGTRKELGMSEELKVFEAWTHQSRAEGPKEAAKPPCASKAAIPVMLCANSSLSCFACLFPSTSVAQPSLSL